MPSPFSRTFVKCRLTNNFATGKVCHYSICSLFYLGLWGSLVLGPYRVNERYVGACDEGKKRGRDIRKQPPLNNTS